MGLRERQPRNNALSSMGARGHSHCHDSLGGQRIESRTTGKIFFTLLFSPSLLQFLILKFSVQLDEKWYEAFVTEIPDGALDYIGHQLLDLYEIVNKEKGSEGSQAGIPGLTF